jgi:hypothetical protein
MPQEIFIPSKGKTLTFADDFSDQEIADYIDANFPRSGEDVAYDLKNRLLDPEWNPSYEDFEKLRKYNTEKDINTAEVVRNIAGGIVEMGGNLLKAIPAAVSDPTAIPGSAARGLVNNLKTYSMLAQGGVDPGSPLFNMMNGDSITAYSTWRDSILAARDLAETSNAAIGGMPVNPQQVAGAEIIADPMNLVPMVGMGGKGGAMAAKAVGAAGQLAERAGKAAVRAATYPERLFAKAAETLAGVPANVAERTAQDLATKAAVVDVATGFIPGATEIAATKAAGRGVAAAGEAIAAAAGEAVGEAGMLSSVEKAAMNPNLSTGARAILNVTARLIPRDAALIASDAAKAGLVGATIGGGLGYLQSRDEEEIGKAIGGGLAAGTIIGGGLKLYDVASGNVAKERVFNDAARNIAKAAAAGESEADLGFRADLFSKLGESDRKGNNLGTFLVMEDLINQRGGKVKVVDGEVVKGPGGETGWNAYYDPNDKTIYINRSGADATTLPHETVHAFLTDVLADELTGRLFAKDAEGRLQQTAPDGAIAGLIEGYLKDADNITRPDGTTEGQRLRERLDAAFDPATPISEQVSRLRDITHEISARYAEQWVTKQNPRNFLTGAMPTIWSEAVNVARGKLDKLFGRETGNPVLDPTLKRIFSPKESGAPDRVGVPLDPRVLTQDFSDKKGKFMSLYKKSDANARQHWNPVWAKVEPILAQGGASKPLNARFEKNNLSLRGVGDDVIDGLARTNIETPLKSSGPILSAQEAAYTKMAIRAMQTGELLQGNNYMAFLKEGQAESGTARSGNPIDKRLAVVDVLWNKDNGVQILGVDIGSALNKLAADVRSKGSASGFDSIAQANKALNQYLRHVADSEGNFDAAKKGWEIEVDGKPMGKTAHKTLHEALNFVTPQDKVPYRPDINIQRGGINRVSGIEFILPRRITGNLTQTGVVTPISNKGVEAIQLRFQPQRTKVEQMPKGMIAQDADGARIVKTDTSGYRLFDPIGNRIGVFSTLEKAAEAATTQAGKDLATVKEIQYAIQEQRAKEISVRQRTLNREAVRQGDTQGQEAAGVRFQPQKEEVFDQVAVANKTARAAGAVGDQAVTVQWLSRNLSPNESVLNFGAGRPDKSGKYGHSEALRKAGATVSEYDFGQNAVGTLGGQYDTVMASNVLNVQGSVEMLKETISQMASEAKPGGRIVFNYPDSPRHLDNLESRYKAAKKAGNETEASALRKEKNATTGEVARVIEEVTGVEPRKVGGTSKEPIWEVRFQPKRKNEKPLPRTSFPLLFGRLPLNQVFASSLSGKRRSRSLAEMGEQIAKREKGMAESAQRRTDRDVAAPRIRFGAEGTAPQAEAAIAQDITARRLQEDAALFAKPKKAPVSDEQLAAIREAGVAETYVKALLDFEDAYSKLTGEEPVDKSYRNEMMKMTDRQKDAILRLALSSDLPQAKLAIEVAREAADPAMRTAIERMFYAQEYGALWQEELTAQQSKARPKTESERAAEYGVNRLQEQLRQSVEQLMKPSARQQAVYGVNPNRAALEIPKVPSMRELQGLRRGVREATEGALQDVRARGEAEAAQIAAEREAKLAQVEESATQAAAALSEEMAQRFKKIKAEIAKAEEVVTAEQEPIRKDRIILKLNGKYRLYGATAGLIGVFRNREDAIKKAKK